MNVAVDGASRPDNNAGPQLKQWLDVLGESAYSLFTQVLNGTELFLYGSS